MRIGGIWDGRFLTVRDMGGDSGRGGGEYGREG
jgi:hypothetical protein